jgi:hypothetical protein
VADEEEEEGDGVQHHVSDDEVDDADVDRSAEEEWGAH